MHVIYYDLEDFICIHVSKGIVRWGTKPMRSATPKCITSQLAASRRHYQLPFLVSVFPNCTAIL